MNRCRPKSRWVVVAGIGAALTAALTTAIFSQSSDAFNDLDGAYMHAIPHDSVARLQHDIDSGKVSLTFDSRHGYLPSVLHQLGITPASQILVFSKTSFQRDRITPQSPRALYFGDSAYVGWLQDSPVLEISTADPKLGAVFYLLPQVKSAHPTFVRQNYECLQCHASIMTGGTPGHIMRSVYCRADGMPDFAGGGYLTTDRSPFSERWGGWYVTGTHGSMRHMGNGFAQGSDGAPSINEDAGANVIDLRNYLDITPYLARTSDIVSLMVIEHQTHVQNLIARANYEVRSALAYELQMDAALSRAHGQQHSDSTMRRLKSVCEPLVAAMLFDKEAPLTATVAGSPAFATQFMALGPRDSRGRSLRDFDLKHRLFRYPCSFTVYSPAFDAMEPLARDYVMGRLVAILSGADHSPDYAYLSAANREAILEILVATKPAFASLVTAHKQPG